MCQRDFWLVHRDVCGAKNVQIQCIDQAVVREEELIRFAVLNL
jgi:hypothetical protein